MTVEADRNRIAENVWTSSVQKVLMDTTWVPRPPSSINFTDHYMKVAVRRGLQTPVGVMNPSPGCTKIVQEVTNHRLENTTDYLLEIKATPTLRKETLELIKTLPTQQVTHRSRVATVGSRLLQGEEFQRRVKIPLENMDLVEKVKLDDGLSMNLATSFASLTLKYLKFDIETLRKYKKDHAKSSVVPGMRWEDAPDPPHEIYEQLFESAKSMLERWASGDLEGHMPGKPMFTGLRARTTQQVDPSDPGRIYYWDEDRSRLVMFRPPFSTVTAFIPDKKGYYRDALQLGLDMIKPNTDGLRMVTPLVEGAETYVLASDALTGAGEPIIVYLGDDWNYIANGEIFPWDGKTADSYVGVVLGSGFWPVLTSWGGIAHLPSGIWCTSILDMYMMMCASKLVTYKRGNTAEGMMEWQPEDYESQFLLGLRFKEDPLVPRLQGIKLSADSPQQGRSEPPFNVSKQEIVTKASHDPYTVERWIDSYHGVFSDGSTILEELQKFEVGDFFDPSVFVSKTLEG